jgi:putative phage-type endonuclease
MIDTEILEQRSDEWRQARVGHVTASRVADIIKTINGGKAYSTKRANYLDEIVSERITDQPADWKEIRTLNDRAALEPDARACYSFYTGHQVKEIGFVRHPVIPYAGASPDGIVGKAGMIEIKCLDSKNHLKLFTERWDDVVAEYLPQMQFGLCCTGRKWCDFVAFNPTMPEDLKLFTLTVKRDESAMERLERAVEEFLAEVDAKVEAIRSKAAAIK